MSISTQLSPNAKNKKNNTINSIKFYNRALTDEEMLKNYRIEHERFNMKSKILSE